MLYNKNLQLKILWSYAKGNNLSFSELTEEFDSIKKDMLLANFKYLVEAGYLIVVENDERYRIHASGVAKLYPEYYL